MITFSCACAHGKYPAPWPPLPNIKIVLIPLQYVSSTKRQHQLSRGKYFALLPNSVQKQIFADKISSIMNLKSLREKIFAECTKIHKKLFGLYGMVMGYLDRNTHNILQLTRGSNFPVRDISQLLKAASTILFTVSCVSSPLITAASPSPIVCRMVWVEWRMCVNIVVSSVRDIPSSSFRLNTRKSSIQRSWKEPWSTTARPHTNSSKLILPF